MTTHDQEQADLDTARREGLAWVDLLTSGQATVDDVQALRHWRDSGATQAQALQEAMRLRRAMETLATEPKIGKDPIVRHTKPYLSRRMLIGGGLVAGAGGLMVMRPPAGLWPSYAELTADERTVAGERRRLELASGVFIDLNTRTSVEFSRGESNDGVRLISGEAMLQSQAVVRPAYIEAGDVRALTNGDADFSIRLLPKSVCVTCARGTVILRGDHGGLRLSAGQQVVYDRLGFGPLKSIDVAAETAWRRGFIVFRNAPLSTVVGEINRYRSGRIVLANQGLKNRPVYGAFRTDRTDALIHQIEALSGAHATHLPGGMVVLT